MPLACKEIQQSLINERPSIISLKITPEIGLAEEDVDWLRDSISESDKTIGVYPAFTKHGSLTAIAYATATRVLLVHSLCKTENQPQRRQKKQANGLPPSILAIRKYLQDAFLDNAEYTLLAFDGHVFALAAYDVGLVCSNVVDLLSLPPHSRNVVQMLDKSLKGSEVHDRNFVQKMFESDLYNENETFSLSQKSWLAARVGSHNTTGSELRKDMDKVPRINVSEWDNEVCHFQ